MPENQSLGEVLELISTESWAIAYAYKSPTINRNIWYDRWRYDVVNDYIEAVSLLGAEPCILDINELISGDKLSRGEFDFVINLNSGATPISNLGLVPSLSEWNGVCCFPNTSDVILAGERKDICKKIFEAWFQMPKELTVEGAKSGDIKFIVKPKTMGNSQGVQRDIPMDFDHRQMMIEEFITGYELTVPVYFDARIGDYVTCPPVVYFPNVPQPADWFFSYQEKMRKTLQIERKILALTDRFQQAILDASRFFQFQTVARFDFRWAVDGPDTGMVDLDDAYFLEINCLPTLRKNINFLRSLSHHLEKNPCQEIRSLSQDTHEDVLSLAFLLAQARAGSMTKCSKMAP